MLTDLSCKSPANSHDLLLAVPSTISQHLRLHFFLQYFCACCNICFFSPNNEEVHWDCWIRSLPFYAFGTRHCHWRQRVFVCPSATLLAHSFIHCSSVRLERSCYIDISWTAWTVSMLNETYQEYSLALADDLITFWRSEVKDTAGRRGGEVIHVNLGHWSPFCLLLYVLWYREGVREREL